MAQVTFGVVVVVGEDNTVAVAVVIEVAGMVGMVGMVVVVVEAVVVDFVLFVGLLSMKIEWNPLVVLVVLSLYFPLEL